MTILTFWFIHWYFNVFLSLWNTQWVWRTLGVARRLQNGPHDPFCLQTHPFCHVTARLFPSRGGADYPTLWIWVEVAGFGHWKVVEVMPLDQLWAQPPGALLLSPLEASCRVGEPRLTHWRMGHPGGQREALPAGTHLDQPCPGNLARCCRWMSQPRRDQKKHTGQPCPTANPQTRKLSKWLLCWAAKLWTGLLLNSLCDRL